MPVEIVEVHPLNTLHGRAVGSEGSGGWPPAYDTLESNTAVRLRKSLNPATSSDPTPAFVACSTGYAVFDLRSVQNSEILEVRLGYEVLGGTSTFQMNSFAYDAGGPNEFVDFSHVRSMAAEWLTEPFWPVDGAAIYTTGDTAGDAVAPFNIVDLHVTYGPSGFVITTGIFYATVVDWADHVSGECFCGLRLGMVGEPEINAFIRPPGVPFEGEPLYWGDSTRIDFSSSNIWLEITHDTEGGIGPEEPTGPEPLPTDEPTKRLEADRPTDVEALQAGRSEPTEAINMKLKAQGPRRVAQ